jgi:(p)ppGpp synthase/HD superfamily hydrolase
MAHLLGVASLVMGENGYVHFPVTEDMVIGALLHDAVEDEGGLPRLRDIEANFGKEVAKIVEGCCQLNRSTQHFLEAYSQEFEILKFFLGVDLSATPLCRDLLAYSRTGQFS